MFDKHKNNIVILLLLSKSKNIVVLLNLSKSKKYCHFANFEQVKKNIVLLTLSKSLG